MSRFGWMTLATVVLASTTWSFAQRGDRSQGKRPGDTLPATGCFVFGSFDGLEAHEADWQQTAAYASLVNSGFLESIENYIVSQLDAQGLADDEAEETLRDVVTHFRDHGGALAVYGSDFASRETDQADKNSGIPAPDVVLAFAHGNEMFDQVSAAYDLLLSRGLLPPSMQAEEDGDGYVLGEGNQSITVWVDNDVFYVTGPPEMADSVKRRMAAGGPAVVEHALYSQSGSCSRGFIDVEAILNRVSDVVGPSPKGFSVREIADKLGLGGLKALVAEATFNGAAVDHVCRVLIDSENAGLFDPARNESMTLRDLPKLPKDVAAFGFTRFDLLGLYDDLLQRIRSAASEFDSAEELLELDSGLANAEAALGFPVRDIFAGFGDILGAYDQTDAGLLAPPIVLVASVRDRGSIAKVFRSFVTKGMEEADDNLTLTEANEDGYDRLTISTGTPISVSLGLSDDWAVIAMTPSYLTDFFKREANDKAGWSADADILARRPELNGEFQGISYVDVAGSWKDGLGLLPMAFAGISQATGNNVPLPRLPRTRTITRPMFPNVGVTIATEEGLVSRSSQSVFSLGNRFSASGTNIGVIGVGTALLLPAVQAAREAARRTTSKNNLKMFGLAMHNYHDTFGAFPAGTIADSADAVEDRLAWTVSVAPFLDMNRISKEFDTGLPWDAESNLEAAGKLASGTFLNPSMGETTTVDGEPVSHFAGCAGVGEGAELLPVTHKRAGMFGANRATKMRDILDGTSNTLMIGEVDSQLGAWTAGGTPTMRAFTQKPYINGPDGFGGNHPGGSQFVFGDGSVRFLSENVDSSVAEALMTIRGGEVIGEF